MGTLGGWWKLNALRVQQKIPTMLNVPLVFGEFLLPHPRTPVEFYDKVVKSVVCDIFS